MNCKQVHKKIIFFVENELPAEEMQQVSEHLAACPDCALFAEEVRKTLGMLEQDRLPAENPFFYTRVKARLESGLNSVSVQGSLLVRVLQPAVFTILLLAGIYAGAKLGSYQPASLSMNSSAVEQIIPYFNELETEPIEAFLME